MNERKMREVLEIDDYRSVFEILLKGDLTTKEVRKKSGFKKEACSNDLSRLEGCKLVFYSAGKWSVTEEGKEVYEKFFG